MRAGPDVAAITPRVPGEERAGGVAAWPRPTQAVLLTAIVAGLGFLVWFAAWSWAIKTVWQLRGLPEYATWGRFFHLWVPLAGYAFAMASLLCPVPGDAGSTAGRIRQGAGLVALPLFLLMALAWPRSIPLWIWLGLFFVGWIAVRAGLFFRPLWRAMAAAVPSRAASIRVGVGSLLVYALVVPWVAQTLPLAGDEPHYLLVAHSLLVDHDLDLQNNYERGDYRAFHPGHLSLQGWGSGVSAHGVGFPLLILPGYAVGGRLGATWLVAGLAVLLSLNIYWFCLEVSGSPRASLAAWALCAFTVPVITYANQLFPEIAAALAALYAYRTFRAHPLPVARARLSGILATFGLIVVKIRYAPIAAALWVHLAVRQLREDRPGWRWALPVLAFVVALPLADLAWFSGSILMTRFGDASQWLPLLRPNRFHLIGPLGLLFDQKAGLLFYAPVYVFGLLGVALLLRERRPDGVVIAGVSAVYLYLLLGHAREHWHGEFSPSPRYLVVLLPLLAGPMALAFERCRGRAFDGARIGLGLYSLAVAATLVLVPRWRFRTKTGQNTILYMIDQAFSVSLMDRFPSFAVSASHAAVVSVIGLALVSLLIAYGCVTAARAR
jgi:hypothetical protein